MSVLRRSLIAVPVALTAIALFAATSKTEWQPFAQAELDATITTDADGLATGDLVVVVDAEVARDSYTLLTQVENEDARRSLKAWDEVDGQEFAQRVKDVAGFFRYLPQDCEEFEEGLPDEAEVCTVRVELGFEGRDEVSDEVVLRAEVGGFDIGGDDIEDAIVELRWEPAEE